MITIFQLPTDVQYFVLILYQPSANATKYREGVYYTGFKVLNMLPIYIKTEFDNPKKFKVVLQRFLHENSSYSLDEYFKLQKSSIFTNDFDRHMNILVRSFSFFLPICIIYIFL
jgi:hypothetical protein